MEEPGNLEFHDLRIFWTPGNIYLWIFIYQMTLKPKEIPQNLFAKYYLLKIRNFESVARVVCTFRSGGLHTPLGVVCIVRSKFSA